tara:strand:+ start:3331 stop:4365 length:1035 start_codon:yes stop_codon:yes gene_type:complete
MKIALIHNDLPPYRIDFFNKLNSKHDLEILLSEKKQKFRNWNSDEFSLNLNDKCFFKFFGFWLPRIKTLKKFNKKFDAIITIDSLPFILLNSFLLIFFKNKLIFWSAFHLKKYKNSFLKRILFLSFFYLFSSRIEKLIAYSEDNYNSLISKFNFKNHVYGTQGADYYINSNKSKVIKSKKILFIGYLRNFPNKGLSLLLEFIRKNNDYELGIIGDGPNLIHHKTNFYDLKRIKFYGYLDGKAKTELMKKYCLLVLPSISFEPWGWVVPEALSLGLNVLVSDNVMSKEIVKNNSNKHVFKSGDYYDLEQKILNYKFLSPTETTKSVKKYNSKMVLNNFEYLLEKI